MYMLHKAVYKGLHLLGYIHPAVLCGGVEDVEAAGAGGCARTNLHHVTGLLNRTTWDFAFRCGAAL